MARIDDLVTQIHDRQLRERIESALADLRKRQRFGLVYEDHVPESTLLPHASVQVGATVQKRSDLIPEQLYTVRRITKSGNAIIQAEGAEEQTCKLRDLMVVKRFGEPMYPTLTPLGRVEGGADDRGHHSVINGENFHALQLLVYLYEERFDCIYISERRAATRV
ncbi:hypothetical protein [Agrobacterium rubi]|uniref:Uncharacterized protein n=1 Tax=Agrobacterium rubi TaxID=28099 RepID=A0AAE7R9D0_9HYPH|nr:hypothetical protein [Agrobacterium rubi]NTE88780.1 hypothetical protein [Agrobacterium rubi]NTF04608.1 hypothetical protein [Agrobacterium rubi]NTF39170.1 hypothetical protein [Agrobacterium rubi]OCJ51320.1 hypothetical protein A6U92_06805 [Agrobacterium rubi]QTG02818.1 hypothetical protein G6M88_20830 [Agrobacterium rubi]